MPRRCTVAHDGASHQNRPCSCLFRRLLAPLSRLRICRALKNKVRARETKCVAATAILPPGRPAQGHGNHPKALCFTTRAPASNFPHCRRKHFVRPCRRCCPTVNYWHTNCLGECCDEAGFYIRKLPERSDMHLPIARRLVAVLCLLPALAGAAIHFISGQVPPVVDKAADPNSHRGLRRHQDPDGRRAEENQRHPAGHGTGHGRRGRRCRSSWWATRPRAARATWPASWKATPSFSAAHKPNLPARAVFQVAGLSNPGWLIEIEVVAAKK